MWEPRSNSSHIAAHQQQKDGNSKHMVTELTQTVQKNWAPTWSKNKLASVHRVKGVLSYTLDYTMSRAREKLPAPYKVRVMAVTRIIYAEIRTIYC